MTNNQQIEAFTSDNDKLSEVIYYLTKIVSLRRSVIGFIYPAKVVSLSLA